MADLAERTAAYEEKRPGEPEKRDWKPASKESALSRLIRETKEEEFKEEQLRKERDFRDFFTETRSLEVSWKEGKGGLFSKELLR